MAALTTTIEDNFGSGVVVPGRGFLLNNEMTDFSFDSDTGPPPRPPGPCHGQVTD